MPTIRKSLAQIKARPLTAAQRARLRKLGKLADAEIDFADAPEITAEDLASGRVRLVRRGGKRPGAGRKPSGNEPVTLRLRSRTIKRLHAIARRQGRTLSDVAEEKLAEL